MQGATFVQGGQLPFELFDAIALSEEEADALQTDENVRRMLAVALRRR